jgi:chromosomal replication initiator protein
MKAWEVFLEELERELGKETVDQWLRSLRLIRFDAANLYLSAQDKFQTAWFEEHIRPRLKRLVNNNGRPIAVHLALPKNLTPAPSSFPPPFSLQSDPLDADMTLENFLLCKENEIAYQLIATLETKPFNPIFFYGPHSSGKTHLLMSAAHLLRKKKSRVFYVKAETFTQHVISAIRLQLMEQFRKVYREVDALIIDDIEALKGKNATQEEFFHTFNALHTAGKHLLFSSSLPPSQLPEIEPRLISRFEWGISTGLQRGDFHHILEKKAALWNWPLSTECIAWLISHFPSGPIVPLHTLALRTQFNKNLTVEQIALHLKDLLAKEQSNTLTPEQVVKKIAAHYGIRPEDMLGKSQTRECAVPRKIAMYLIREKLKLPYQEIGEFFHRDHSTAIDSIRQVKKGIEENNRAFLDACETVRF